MANRRWRYNPLKRPWDMTEDGVDRSANPWQFQVEDKDLNTPPGSPSIDQRWIVAASPTGDWAGHYKDIAEWNGTDWTFYTPSEGWTTWVLDEKQQYIYTEDQWYERFELDLAYEWLLIRG